MVGKGTLYVEIKGKLHKFVGEVTEAQSECTVGGTRRLDLSMEAIEHAIINEKMPGRRNGKMIDADATWRNYRETDSLFRNDCYKKLPKIDEIIFNPPATIVKWDDGTKTVVKTDDNDEFNYETGVAMALAKKYFGSRHQFQKKVGAAKFDYLFRISDKAAKKEFKKNTKKVIETTFKKILQDGKNG